MLRAELRAPAALRRRCAQAAHGRRAASGAANRRPQTFLMQKQETNYVALNATPTQLVHTRLPEEDAAVCKASSEFAPSSPGKCAPCRQHRVLPPLPRAGGQTSRGCACLPSTARSGLTALRTGPDRPARAATNAHGWPRAFARAARPLLGGRCHKSPLLVAPRPFRRTLKRGSPTPSPRGDWPQGPRGRAAIGRGAFRGRGFGLKVPRRAGARSSRPWRRRVRDAGSVPRARPGPRHEEPEVPPKEARSHHRGQRGACRAALRGGGRSEGVLRDLVGQPGPALSPLRAVRSCGAAPGRCCARVRALGRAGGLSCGARWG